MPTTPHLHGQRSFTGHHTLLPATRPILPSELIPKIPTYTFLKWTFGRGSVFWKVWPAILLHTAFAAVVVCTWHFTGRMISIPNVMLTVLGVVIGFVISYRAMSGYDRYWMGRTTWSDVIRNARTCGRLIWYHVPLRVSPREAGEAIGSRRSEEEMQRVMQEKRAALDLVEGFVVALKHHLRGELGIYYEDIYDLIKPLHDHEHPSVESAKTPTQQLVLAPGAHAYGTFTSSSDSSTSTLRPASHASKRPVSSLPSAPTTSTLVHATANPSTISLVDAHTPLLPASNPSPEDAILRRVAPEMIPFGGLFSSVGRVFSKIFKSRGSSEAATSGQTGRTEGAGGADSTEEDSNRRTWSGPVHPANNAHLRWKATRERNALTAHIAHLIHTGHEIDASTTLSGRENTHKHDGHNQGLGENLPAEILRCLSDWLGVLEERGSVPGTTIGQFFGCIQAFEISLTTLEQVLTTPLPFVYAVHIRQNVDSVVWLYLFLLPIQLVSTFAWHTIPAVTVGAFVYLGFVAAGEEIEQPFGYDDNDLDLDMFCRDIVRPDIQCLKRTPGANVWLGRGRKANVDYHRVGEESQSPPLEGSQHKSSGVSVGAREAGAADLVHRAPAGTSGSEAESGSESVTDVDGA
ncbi:UPF0187-domain-containing protein [Mycena rebaudengoi]|nr:UPF0187-domain-containing protein [Mycena rebaudengoi]